MTNNNHVHEFWIALHSYCFMITTVILPHFKCSHQDIFQNVSQVIYTDSLDSEWWDPYYLY